MTKRTPPSDCDQPATPRRFVSSGGFSGRLVVTNSQPALDPYSARRRFGEQWAEWCRANYRSPVHLAAAFGICEKTARLWWEGTNAPQGWAVGYALVSIEGAAEFFARKAA